ncbi:MAG TPA: hypothetical protein VGB21_02535 [Candidatus Methylomirabilis sp.]
MSVKFYIEALRKLPEEYIADDTHINANIEKKCILVVRPMFPPIIFDQEKKEWVKIIPAKLTKPPKKVRDN